MVPNPEIEKLQKDIAHFEKEARGLRGAERCCGTPAGGPRSTDGAFGCRSQGAVDRDTAARSAGFGVVSGVDGYVAVVCP